MELDRDLLRQVVDIHEIFYVEPAVLDLWEVDAAIHCTSEGGRFLWRHGRDFQHLERPRERLVKALVEAEDRERLLRHVRAYADADDVAAAARRAEEGWDTFLELLSTVLAVRENAIAAADARRFLAALAAWAPPSSMLVAVLNLDPVIDEEDLPPPGALLITMPAVPHAPPRLPGPRSREVAA